MHVAMIIDEERLLHEQLMLNRLVIGLIDHGAQVTRIIPDVVSAETIDAGEQRIALTPRIQIPMRVLPWMRRTRAERLAEVADQRPFDLVYAVGEQAWSIGLDLSRTIEQPLALNVWAASLIRRVPRARHQGRIGCYITPTPTLASKLGRRVERDLVSMVPMGVSVPREPRNVLAERENAIGLAVIGGGRDTSAYESLLAALSRIVREWPQVQIVLELRGPRAHEIWRQARRLDLLSHISTISDAAHHRSLLTRCDGLLIPERSGEMNSLILDAMAMGLPVVANEDANLDMLCPEAGTRLLDDPSPDSWYRNISTLIKNPEDARAAGMKGRDLVARRYRSIDQVERLMQTFEMTMSGGSYRIHA